MKNSCLALVILVSYHIAVYANGNNTKANPSENQKTELAKRLHGNGLCFTPNKGQIADVNGKQCPDVLYKGDGGEADVYLRKKGISYVHTNMGAVIHEVEEQVEDLIKAGTLTKAEEQKKKDELLQNVSIKVHRVDMDFEGANNNAKQVEEDELEGYNNYYYPHCPKGILNVKQYNKVTYKNIYNGIDIAYGGGTENGLKYDLIVHPHADPNQIKLHWKGAESIYINRQGHLVIKTSLNEFTESIPKVYQIINGEIVDIKAQYKLDERCEMLDMRDKTNSHISCLRSHLYNVTFELGTWNPEHPLIIDPWATYYGGTGADYGTSVACDNNGNVYLAGYTGSANAIAIATGFQTVFGGGLYDAFLVKFNSATGVRIWATYYGGTGDDYGRSVACDNTGNVYLAGRTNSPNAGNVMATAGGFKPVFGGTQDAFLVKFNSATGLRTWATYYGGTGIDDGYSVACDTIGNVYLAGTTQSPNTSNVMATVGGFKTVLGGTQDAFLVKFNSTTGLRNWATYYGGSQAEFGFSVACDNTGNVYLAGITGSPNAGNVIATTTGISGFQTVFGGGTYDAFLVQFNSGTGARIWATYYGGTGMDDGFSVACDNAGNVYLAGRTASLNLSNVIAVAPGFQTVFGGIYDVFLVQFNSATGVRNWGTYYGSNLFETLTWGCLAIDGSNNVYLYMEVEDEPGPNLIDACAYQPNFAGGIEDQIIVKFNSAGKKLCATYLGGTGYEDTDLGGGIAISSNLLFICASNGNGGVAGANAGGYPVTPGAHQTVHGGNFDAVLACLCINICEGKTSLGLGFTAATSVCANTPVTFTSTISNSCDTTRYKYHWVFTNGTPATSDSMKPTVSFSGVGTHNVKLVVTTLCKKDSVEKLNYITTTQCVVCNLVGQFTKGTANCAVCGCKEWIMVNVTGGASPYTYSWPDGYDKRYKNQLCPGAYTIKVVDTNGCSTNLIVNAP